MPNIHEIFSEQFEMWEIRGRGGQVFDQPVFPEPPFVPFAFQPMPQAADDGHRPTFLSSLVQGLSRKLATPKPSETNQIEAELDAEPEPTPLVRDALLEFQASLPNKLDISKDAFEHFLSSLSFCHEPIAFELVATHRKVTAQFVAAVSDAPLVRRQLAAFFPEAAFVPIERGLESALAAASDEILAVEFGLEKEFMLPLASGKLDPFIGIIGALAELQSGEVGLFQVLFQPVQHPWAENIVRSVTHADGKPFFVNSPELVRAAENKVARPLFAVVVRILISAAEFDRILQLAHDLAGSLRVFAHPQGNALVPLHNAEYPFEAHIEDVLRRQTRRSGMLLNSDELTGFAHLPSTAVRSPVFQRQMTKTKAVTFIARHEDGLFLGNNEHAGETVAVRLSPEQRVKHTHIIGASGTGKSTLLFNLIQQSIGRGEGVAVLDPHGDLITRVLGIIPPERIDDVVLVDPTDDQFPIGFNILSAHTDLEKNLLASDLVAVFERLSDSWGVQMNSVLQNAILAFLESDRRGTIADLRRFLIEPAFRNEFLKSVKDSEVVYYWQKSFPHLSGSKSIGSILVRLDALLAQKPIRNMVSQPDNKLDFAHIMDSGKIFLARLPEGILGRANSHLLGTLMVSKFQQIAMSRQAQQIESRRLFNIFIDEFANFITPSMAEILSGARKYRIGLTLAHHELHQLQRSPEVASAVMTHPYTRIVFRVGDDDAKKLAEGFAFFEPQDLRNLETGQAVCRVERSDFDFNLSVPLFPSPDVTAMAARRQEVITRSRNKYGTARVDVEAMLATSRASAPTVEPTSAATIKPVAETPKAAEVPKTVVPPPVVTEIPKIAELPPAIKPEPPRDSGRGGAQHQAIQKRIKEAAEALGFRSVIEKPVLDGQGSVDLWLERTGAAIACEISISTTVDHEVRNVSKCLKAGVPKVAVICLDDERLRKIRNAVSGSLGAEPAARVEYFQPEPFIAYLKALQPPAAQPSESEFNGYKIKRSMPKLSATEQEQRADIAHRVMADSLKRKQPNL